MPLKHEGCIPEIEILVKRMNKAVHSNFWKIEGFFYLDTAMKLEESTTDFQGTIIKSMASCLMTNHSMSVLRLTGQNLQNVLHGWKTPI